MGNSAEIKWTADDAAVIRSFEKMERNMDNLARKMDRVEKASKQAAATTTSGLERMAAGVAKAALAYAGAGSLLTAIDTVREANRKMLEEAQEVGKEYDRIFRSFRVQAGLSELEGAKAKDRILTLAERNAVKEDIATAGAKGLVGAGFSVASATGPALNELLKARAATNATGGNADDLESLSTSVAAYLTSQGKEKTAENLRSVLQGAFALRQTGAAELSDLTELGKHGAALRGYLSQEEQFAAFGTLVDQMPAAEAATSLRNIVSRLATSKSGRTSAKALKQIGLKPDDVDLVGEDFSTVMGRLDSGLAGLPEKDRASVLKLLFEEAGVAPARALMREREGRFLEYRQGQRTAGAEFEGVVNVAQAGREAAGIRLDVGLNRQRQQADEGDDLVLKQIEAEQRTRGIGALGRYITPSIYNTARFLGASQETAIGLTHYEDEFAPNPGTYTPSVYGGVRRNAGGDTGVPKLEAAIERNTQAIERNTRESTTTRSQPRVRDRVESLNGR